MAQSYSIKLKKIVEAHNLQIVHKASNYEEVEIGNYNVARPSLQLVGFYDFFEPDRLRIWGKAEEAFLRTTSDE